MKRIYFLVPDIDNTTKIVQELRDAGLHDGFIHVVGKDHEALESHHLHEASLVETTDAVPAMGKGMAAGAAVGFLAGLAAVAFPPAGLVLGGGAMLGLGLFGAGAGAGLGAGISSLIGMSQKDDVVERLQSAIEEGQFLMLVDVSNDRENEVMEMVRIHHPEARIEGAKLEDISRVV